MTEIQINQLKELKSCFDTENRTAFQQELTPEQAERYYYLTMGQRVAMNAVFAILDIDED